MSKYSSLQIFLVGCIFFESNVKGQGLFGSFVPEFGPELATRNVPACKGHEEAIFGLDLLNSVNTLVFKEKPQERSIAPCEYLEFKGVCDKCNNCDLSYVVLILTKSNGKLMVNGQGLRLSDDSIVTTYKSIQIGEGLWVRYYNGITKKVICVKTPRKCEYPNNLLITLKVVTVELEVEKDDSCPPGIFKIPKFGTTSKPFLPTCIITPTNISCPSSSLTSISSLYQPITEFLSESLSSVAYPNDVKKVGPGTSGGVIINENCEVLGMATNLPIVAYNLLDNLPVANQVGTGCATPIIPLGCFLGKSEDKCGCK